MAKDNLNVTAKAETVAGAKAKAQNAAAKEIDKKKKEADLKAEEALEKEKAEAAEREAARKKAAEEKEAARKAAEEAAAAQQKAEEEAAKAAEEARKEKEKKIKQTAAAGATIAAAAYQSAKKEGLTPKISKGFIAGLLIGAVLGLVVGFFVFQPKQTTPSLPASVTATVAPVEDADVTIDNDGALGYTAADFQEAVLGAASEHQELIVFEQELSVPTTLTKSGLGNLAVFSKMKNITYFGTGVYTVDMSKMDAEHILVDEEKHVVTILIPHTVLQYVNAELEKTEFEETDKGLLSFGDIKLTAEETNKLETAVMAAMRTRLDSADMYEEADRFAILKTWEIFQPLVTAVSPTYKVEMQFEVS